MGSVVLLACSSSSSSASLSAGEDAGAARDAGAGMRVDGSSTRADGSPGARDAAGDVSVPPPTGPIGTTPASRLLTQGTFGPTLDGITVVSQQTYAEWFAAQAALPPTLLAPQVASVSSNLDPPWWTTAVTAPDQLRQRVAFALSQILVVSQQAAALTDNASQAIAGYNDILVNGCLGNFRDLLTNISLSPVMGTYLTYFRNQDDPSTGIHADENYAREVMQLFTIGLWQLSIDGTQTLDSGGNPTPTYAIADVENLARVFTGWASHAVSFPAGSQSAWEYDQDLTDTMDCYAQYHDTTAKTFLGTSVPAGGTCQTDMKIALDAIFNHPNVGPFLAKLLIQRLVTSNPSTAYVTRVATAFNDDGTGTRGNLLAVVEAILEDPEARTAGSAAKLREPILRFTELYRAFSAIDQGDALISEQEVELYSNFDEAPWYSPTVFNFYSPTYLRPGPLYAAGLYAPEFQITNEYTLVVLQNQMEASSYQYKDSTGAIHTGADGYSAGSSAETVLLSTSEWEPYATSPSMLVQQLNLVFMAGQMPSNLQTAIEQYLTQFSADAGPTTPAGEAQRVIEATYLVTSSPQFAVQR